MICQNVQIPACLKQLHSSVKQWALDPWKIPQVERYTPHLLTATTTKINVNWQNK